MKEFDIIVIGSGGGTKLVRPAARLGYSVAIIEKDALGGTCLNRGCIPSKMLIHPADVLSEVDELSKFDITMDTSFSVDFEKLVTRVSDTIDRDSQQIAPMYDNIDNITYYKGKARFVGSKEIEINGDVISGKRIYISVGVRPSIPSIPGLEGTPYWTSTEALRNTTLLKRMLVIGGGYIGLEMGSVWSRLGSKVTVVEALDRIVPTMDEEIAKEFMKSLKKQGLEFKLSHKVTSTKVSKSGVDVSMESSDKKQITEKYDVVLMSVGRKPNTEGLNLEGIGLKLNEKKAIEINSQFKTNIETIYAIGDVVPGPMLAHKAEEEGVACVEFINGQKPHINYDIIPAIVYTNPEVASVGKTESQLKDAKVDYKVGKFPFMANGRALTTSSPEGFVKILADSKSDEILGAHIIGHDAGQLIAEIVTTMEFGGSSEDIARICHAHPTTSEAVKEAAMNIDGRAIHI